MNAWIALLAVLAFCAAPFVTDGFAGFTADQFPIPQARPPIQPAGYAFSIWGVIYLWVLVSASYGLWRHRRDATWQSARFWMVLSLAPGALWIKLATLSPVWATVLISWMLLAGVMATLRARLVRPAWALALPLGLYAGWLSAATVVSFGLLAAGYLGANPHGVAGAGLALAVLFGAVLQQRLTGLWSYGLALAWALIGIGVQNAGQAWALAGLAWLGALILLGLALAPLRGAGRRSRTG